MSGDDEARRSGAGVRAGSAATTPVGDIDSHADTAALGHEDTAIGEKSEEDAAAPSAPADGADTLDDLLGVTLQERYRITRKIGQGGMGAVYEAKHLALGKKVAIKVLLEKYASKDRVVARLEQEARLASSIGHDNIVDITDFGETSAGRTFVVMEYLEGESLGQCLAREGALDTPRAVKIARQIASALGAAHKKGIIHRDIKPENIFLRRRNERDIVKVVDFGISKTIRPDEGGDASPRLTQTGMVLGTPLYMSPEQARGDEDPDHRVDIYSLGVILYEMATGEVPFRGNNYLNIVSQVISSEARVPTEINPEVSPDLEAVILKALEKEPEDRYQTMEDLDADLSLIEGGDLGSTSARITAGRRRRRHRRRRLTSVLMWAGAAAVVASLVVIAVMMATSSSEDEPELQAAVSADASLAVAEPEADAAPIPEAELAEIKLVSRPPGASVYRGARHEGVTPVPIRLVRKDQKVTLVFELDGYDDATADVNPLEDEGKTIRVRLRKAKRGGPKKIRRPAADKSTGKPRDPGHSHGGGDLSPPI
jgi:serine/threonine-protein kinase